VSPKSDFMNYIADMRILQSHLEAARKVAIGIYSRNPESRKVKSFDDLAERLFEIEEDLQRAEDDAVSKFRDHLMERPPK